MSTNQSFRHPPLLPSLSSFRVVTITSADPDNTITCALTAIDLQSHKHQYHSLSYLWGDEAPLHTIRIDRQEFQVRQNLFDFLKRAQERFVNIPFFIDAVCINQTNTAERNQQVQMMGDIYKFSKLTVCWLAPAESRVAEALPFIEGLARLTSQELTRLYDGQDRRHCQQAWLGLYLLLDLRYWSRVWIIQEVLKPSSLLLMSGRYILSWETLTTFLNQLKMADPSPAPLPEQLFASRLYQLETGRHQDQRNARVSWMRHVLLTFASSKCSENRDRIFALLSLGKDGDDLRVDYSLPLEKLFMHSVNLWGAQYGSNALCLAKHLADCLSPLESDMTSPTAMDDTFAMKLLEVREWRNHEQCSKDRCYSTNYELEYQIPCPSNASIQPFARSLVQDGKPLDQNSLSADPPPWTLTRVKIEHIKNNQLMCADLILQIADTTMFIVARQVNGTFEPAGKLSIELDEVNGQAEIVTRWLPVSAGLRKIWKLEHRSRRHFQTVLEAKSFRGLLTGMQLEMGVIASIHGRERSEMPFDYVWWGGAPATFPLHAKHLIEATWRYEQDRVLQGTGIPRPKDPPLGQIYQALKTSTLNLDEMEDFKATPSWKELIGRS